MEWKKCTLCTSHLQLQKNRILILNLCPSLTALIAPMILDALTTRKMPWGKTFVTATMRQWNRLERAKSVNETQVDKFLQHNLSSTSQHNYCAHFQTLTVKTYSSSKEIPSTEDVPHIPVNVLTSLCNSTPHETRSNTAFPITGPKN